MDNKKLLLVGGGVIVLILVLGAGFMMMNQIQAPVQTPPPQVTLPNPTPVAPAEKSVSPTAETVVSFDGKTFTPATVTIKKGEAIKFVNLSSVHMEVASAVHPTHEVLPDFDQGKGTSKDKNEYVFTFTKAGSWKYHNHVPFMLGGTVVVTD